MSCFCPAFAVYILSKLFQLRVLFLILLVLGIITEIFGGSLYSRFNVWHGYKFFYGKDNINKTTTA